MNEVDGIRRRGGLAATHELLADGSTSHRLTSAVRAERIVRVRQGWYGLPDTDAVLASAVRVGGRATATTALRALGLVAREDGRIHVRVGDHASRLRSPRDRTKRLSIADLDVCVHWNSGGSGTRHRMSALDALEDAIGCQPVERVIAGADSAIRAGLVTRRAWGRLVGRQAGRLRDLLAEVDPRSESYLESITRFRLRRLGYLPETQVTLDGIGRVDLLLGRVIVECDGWEHHHDRDAFERDRVRDAESIRRGYLPLRITSRRLVHEWASVRSTIADAVRL